MQANAHTVIAPALRDVFPFDANLRQEVHSRRAALGERSVFACTVVANRRGADVGLWLGIDVFERIKEFRRRGSTAFADALLDLGIPALRDRLAGEVDHHVHSAGCRRRGVRLAHRGCAHIVAACS
jgi:hypothetical protein